MIIAFVLPAAAGVEIVVPSHSHAAAEAATAAAPAAAVGPAGCEEVLRDCPHLEVV